MSHIYIYMYVYMCVCRNVYNILPYYMYNVMVGNNIFI